MAWSNSRIGPSPVSFLIFSRRYTSVLRWTNSFREVSDTFRLFSKKRLDGKQGFLIQSFRWSPCLNTSRKNSFAKGGGELVDQDGQSPGCRKHTIACSVSNTLPTSKADLRFLKGSRQILDAGYCWSRSRQRLWCKTHEPERIHDRTRQLLQILGSDAGADSISLTSTISVLADIEDKVLLLVREKVSEPRHNAETSLVRNHPNQQ